MSGQWIAPPGTLADGMRIGLLGGSFNPAHEGHIHATALALKRLGLDQVWWLVSPQNPLKPEKGMGEFAQRLAGARKLARHPRIRATGIEAQFGTRFTVDTLKALKRRFPRAHFVWIMGSDNLVEIPRWRRWQEIFRLVPIAVVTRPGTAFSARISKAATRFRDYAEPPSRDFAGRRPPAWTILTAKGNPVSATRLRAASPSPG